MKKSLSLLLVAVLFCAVLMPRAVAAGPSRFDGLYDTALNGAVYRVEAGGGTGSLLALAEQGGTAALVRYAEEDASTSGQNLVLFDLFTGKQLAEKALESSAVWPSWNVGFLDDGRVYTLNLQDAALTFYDRELRETFRFTIPGGTEFYDLLPDPDGLHLWSGGVGTAIKRYHLADATIKTVESGLPQGWYFTGFQGKQADRVLFAMANEEGLCVLGSIGDSGPVELSPIPKGLISLPGGISYMSDGESAYFSELPVTGQLLRLETWRENEYPLAYRDGLLLSNVSGAGEPLAVYDLKQGVLVNRLFLLNPDDYSYFGFTALSNEGFALLSQPDDAGPGSTLYLWDFNKGAADEDAGLTRTSIAEIRQAHDAQAGDIFTKFGVRVYFRQAGAGFVNDTYMGYVMDDELRLGAVLQKVDAFFSALPPGMIGEALLAPYTELSVYLAGSIVPKGEDGISSAAGIASYNGAERYIALNAYETSLFTNLAHEFMHVMEDRIWQGYSAAGDALIERWTALGPQDVPDGGFMYSYHQADGLELFDTLLTALDESAGQAPDRVWFIDAYSRSYPLEDRARIFEHLFMAQDTPDPLFEHLNLYKKAQALCAIIREAFPSVQALDQAAWETWIEQVPYETMLKLLDTPEEDLPLAS